MQFTSAILVSVYPRWRGEHSVKLTIGMVPIGLSPLARGTQIRQPGKFIENRFIPAGAGNTILRNSRRTVGTVYPRWRGEHFPAISDTNFRTGLSPLARGTLAQAVNLTVERRFIPAGAGNTPVVSTSLKSPAVYPRWRGEHARMRSTSVSRSSCPLFFTRPLRSRI